MKIEKLNENQLKITLAPEDLSIRGLALNELSYGSTKTKDLYNELIEQALSEFGFESEDGALVIEENEPIADTARGILDGHFILSRTLAQKNHYPAIDVLQSISRCMSAIVTAEHKKLAGNMKNVLATYRSAEDLINIGAYKPGSNPDIDFAISKIKEVNAFLMQKTDEKFLLGDELEELRSIFAETE